MRLGNEWTERYSGDLDFVDRSVQARAVVTDRADVALAELAEAKVFVERADLFLEVRLLLEGELVLAVVNLELKVQLLCRWHCVLHEVIVVKLNLVLNPFNLKDRQTRQVRRADLEVAEHPAKLR